MAKKKRVYRTDEEKERLIQAAEGAPNLSAFARSQGMDANFFRRMRKDYLAAHPNFKPSAQQNLPAIRLAPIDPPTSPFKAADLATKRKMVQAYDRLPMADKKPWREKFQVTDALLGYYRNRLKLPRNKSYSRVPEAVDPQATVPVTDNVTSGLLAEYAALSGRNGKSAWLKQHGLTHQHIWEAKSRGRSLAHKVKQPRRAASNGHDILVIPVTSHPVPTLDEAINAMEVKRDQLSSFIEDLKRMRSTGGVR